MGCLTKTYGKLFNYCCCCYGWCPVPICICIVILLVLLCIGGIVTGIVMGVIYGGGSNGHHHNGHGGFTTDFTDPGYGSFHSGNSFKKVIDEDIIETLIDYVTDTVLYITFEEEYDDSNFKEFVKKNKNN